MDSETLITQFFSSEISKTLQERTLLEQIVTSIPANSALLYDLTFHATFAKRIFDIIRREGPHTQGFERMQQSFIESVDKTRAILIMIESDGRVQTRELTASTPESRARISRFVEDVAVMKNWLLSHQQK